MSIVSDSLRALADALAVPLILAVGLAILIGLLRFVTSLSFLIEHRGLRPLVMQVEYGKAALEGGENYGVLDARLLSYLASDGLGAYIIAPGAGGSAAPVVPAAAQESSAALIRFAFPSEPAYRVDVTWPGPVTQRDDELRATVRISRTPGDRIVATRSFTEDNTEALIEVIGAFCVTFLLGQPRILRRTPRWERWNQDINGYLAYRRGLGAEPRGTEVSTSLEDCRKALEHFHHAARMNPANMLVQLHRASLLELMDENREAAAIYRKCRTLWPEHIEAAYRLWVAHKGSYDRTELKGADHPLDPIREQLLLRRLLRSWLLTWRPNHWNPGERRYWRSWISLRPWKRVSKRTAYLRALAISQLAVELSFLLPGRNAASTDHLVAVADARSGERSAAAGKMEVLSLMTRLADELLRQDDEPAVERLLRPKAGTTITPLAADPAYIPVYAGPHYHRRAVGWLAMFNAACFFSLAILLPPEYIPDNFTVDQWRQCCGQASIHELGLIHRDPRNLLDPNWMARDPDLEPLRQTEIGQEWQNFIGMPRAKPSVRSA
ncbi:tetratricopeptide repeat protein [Trebonia sp.]|uniref:tetratricopeptide repeat protein n=2 Tax=Trebonia sp. TaxID=2767075 RepID=UPI003CBF7FBE